MDITVTLDQSEITAAIREYLERRRMWVAAGERIRFTVTQPNLRDESVVVQATAQVTQSAPQQGGVGKD